jgi:HEAT repeat protein
VFHLRADDALELSPTVYAPYIQQLDSKNEQVRREAARILATFALPALEPLLLTFATSKDYVLKQFAPLALANLSTKASRAALAQMLLDTNPGTYEFMKAAENLGKTHDRPGFRCSSKSPTSTESCTSPMLPKVAAR